jgi:hypothetical protein
MGTGNWQHTFIAVIHGNLASKSDAAWNAKDIISKSAYRYTKKYKLGPDAVLSNLDSHFATIVENDKPSKLLNWVTIFDRLIICAHGSSDTLAHLSPKSLADLLYLWGLRRVGLITFKACDIATGDFFDQFILACQKKPIQVGYLKGYMGNSATVWNENEVKEIVTRKMTGPSGTEVHTLQGNDRFYIAHGSYTGPMGMSHGRFDPI